MPIVSSPWPIFPALTHLAPRLRRLAEGLRSCPSQAWLALSLALLLPVLAWLALHQATVLLAQQRHRAGAEALAHAWTLVPGTVAQRQAAWPALAAGAAAGVQLHDEAGHRLVNQPLPTAHALPDHHLARRLLPPPDAAPLRLTVQGRVWLLQVQAPVDDLWQLQQQVALLLGGLWVALLSVGAGLAARARQRLQATVVATLAQARSLGEAGYVAPQDLPVTALRPVAQAMDQLHQRMRALFDVHAEQLEALRRQAHTDALTGLPNRRHFMAVIEAVLGGDYAPAEAGIVLVRVLDLQGMNQRLGNPATDRVLQALAEVLASYPERIERCAVGRLSGGDFGLLLPAGGVASETAGTLLQTLRGQLARIDPLARVLAGAVELRPPLGATQALVMAQAALAGAESAAAQRGSPANLSLVDAGDAPEDVAWQRRLARALVQGRVRLGEFPVRAPDGRQLLLDSPLRVQLLPGGPFEPASRWLAQATRSRLNTAVDEKAVMLALAAIAQDGQARCINVAAASAASADFLASLMRRLAAAPEAAAQLWVDLPESLALEQPELVRELARRLRALGTMVALEHCGEGLMRVPRLIDLGLDCVRIDGRFVNGIAAERADDARRYLRGLVRLVQSVGLSVTAEGVRAPEDLELLWRMGFDAATGPAVQLDQSTAV